MNKKEIELAKKLEKVSEKKELYGSMEDIQKIIENKKMEICLESDN